MSTPSPRVALASAIVLAVLHASPAFAQVALGGYAQLVRTSDSFAVSGVSLIIDLESIAEPQPGEAVVISGEIELPGAIPILLDPDSGCAPLTTGSDSHDNHLPGETAPVRIEGSGSYSDPPCNTICSALVSEDDPAIRFSVNEGVEQILPVRFPILVYLLAEVTADDPCLDTVIEGLPLRFTYTVGESEPVEVVVDPPPVFTKSSCAAIAGDLDGNGSLNPADAQLAFEAFLQIPEALQQIDDCCSNFCSPGSSGLDPADAQGIFNAFLQIPNPCSGK